ncbi:MAG: hypothetical protein ABI707_04060 [Ferruginibacter sp.]
MQNSYAQYLYLMNEVSKVLITALAAGVFVYFNNFINDKRKAQLERINKQLGEFYGPLYSLIKSNQIAWEAFCKKHEVKRVFFDPLDWPSEEKLIAWRLFMNVVFGPAHEKIYEIIVSKSDLLIEDNMPESLLDLISHILIYKTVRAQWKNGDFTEHTSIINFPGEAQEYISTSFIKLKKEQYFFLHNNILKIVLSKKYWA